jgi:DNA-binding GntR family transcriptional regulator
VVPGVDAFRGSGVPARKKQGNLPTAGEQTEAHGMIGRVVRGHVLSVSPDASPNGGAYRSAPNGARTDDVLNAVSLHDAGVGTLDHGSPIPLYLQLAGKLRDYIGKRGESAVGQALPSENDCIRHFGVSRPTVRQAISELFTEGLIRREKGRGTFIRGRRVEHDITHVFEEDMRAASRRVTFRVLRHGLVAFPSELAGLFAPGPGESMYRVQRVRSVSGRIIGLEDRYFLERFARNLDEKMVSTEHIFAILKTCTGAREVRAVHAVSSELADDATARLLGSDGPCAVLVRETTYYTDPGTPVMYGKVVFLGDRYQLRFEARVELQ